MLPVWAKAFSDDCDEDTILYSIQERFSGSNSTNSDNTGYKVVTQIQKFTNFLEHGVIKGAICILTSTGTVLGAIEQISKKAERSINETVNYLSGTDRAASEEESFFLPHFDDNTDESRWDDEGEAGEMSLDEGNISDSTTKGWKKRRMKVVDESNC